MKGGKSPLGYTIVEVMFVLAASSMMFVIAGTFINGKQSKTSFTSGVNELASRIQDTINQVTDGQYSDIKVNCQRTGSTINFPAGTPNDVGTNSDCFFFGKVMHFSVDGQKDKYDVISMAGRRLQNDNLTPVENDLTQISPKAIPGLTISQTVPQTLNVERIRIIKTDGSVANPESFGIGFLQNVVAGGDTSNGAQTPPALYYVHNMTFNKNTVQGETAASNPTQIMPANSATICVSDGTRSANVIVGINNSQQNVTVRMLGDVTCP